MNQQYAVKLDPELRVPLMVAAAKQGIDVKRYVSQVLEEHLSSSKTRER